MNNSGTFGKPYFAVIFSSKRSDVHQAEYEKMSTRMVELAKSQEGFLGVDSVRSSDGFGITVSYWKSETSIRAWKRQSEHLVAQELGKTKWYESYVTRICRVERDYESTERH
jgi:heme-degrading monooxygenase HmoA